MKRGKFLNPLTNSTSQESLCFVCCLYWCYSFVCCLYWCYSFVCCLYWCYSFVYCLYWCYSFVCCLYWCYSLEVFAATEFNKIFSGWQSDKTLLTYTSSKTLMCNICPSVGYVFIYGDLINHSYTVP